MKLRISLDGETDEIQVDRVEVPALPRDITLVITAAVAAVLEGRPFRIRHIYPTGSAAWSTLGRQQLLTSHNPERKFR